MVFMVVTVGAAWSVRGGGDRLSSALVKSLAAVLEMSVTAGAVGTRI